MAPRFWPDRRASIFHRYQGRMRLGVHPLSCIVPHVRADGPIHIGGGCPSIDAGDQRRPGAPSSASPFLHWGMRAECAEPGRIPKRAGFPLHSDANLNLSPNPWRIPAPLRMRGSSHKIGKSMAAGVFDLAIDGARSSAERRRRFGGGGMTGTPELRSKVFGHPRGLLYIAGTELWDRVSF